MRSIEEVTKTIATNIAAYRKASSLTQAELADKLGYSDKSVSKWEQGNGLPDATNLVNMAEIFGCTVNDLVEPHVGPIKPQKKKWLDFTNKNLIILLAFGASWVVAVLVFVILKLVFPDMPRTWLAFVYAVPVSAITVLVLSCVWHFRVLRFLSVTAIIWSVLLCLYLSFLPQNYWMIFLIGIPSQILTVIAFTLARRIKKKQNKQI